MPDIFSLIEEAKIAYAGKKFNGIPDSWFEPMYFWCRLGHRSRAFLKSEGHGRDECLECFGPVKLGPKDLPGVTPL